MTAREAAPRQARDVMAFGQETGRVLSDEQIVGRAEPFAKVFQSSRVVKQAVGLTAWGILEDIALDATLDAEGRLVADTNARRIAANLGLNKETVTRHLARLREFGFVLHEEVRHRGSGRYATARYVLDPSACIERFTSTPRRQVSDGLRCAPSGSEPAAGRTGRGRSVSSQQDVAGQGEPTAHAAVLLRLGVAAGAASALAARYSPARVQEVADAARRRARRNPAGWAIRALQGGWTVTSTDRVHRDHPPSPPPPTRSRQQEGPDTAAEERWRGWDRAISAALDEDQLARAVALVGSTLPPASRVGPTIRVQLIRWAAHTLHQAGDEDLPDALAAVLAGSDPPAMPAEAAQTLPPPPTAAGRSRPLRERIAALVPAAHRGEGRS